MSNNNILYQLYFYKAIGYKFINRAEISEILTHKNNFSNLKRLEEQIKNCNLCELCKSRNKAVLGGKEASSNVMLVENFPSFDEDKNGSAAFNDELKECLNLAQIDIQKLYFTHMLKCRPKDDMNLKDTWYDQCYSYFEQEFDIVKPKLIISFGKDVFFRITKDRNCAFESVRGGIFKFKNSLIMPTYSAFWIIKNPSHKQKFIDDLKKIKGYL
ncbi:uracil-DNA glycosylase family protein [Campylobacter fetus]|uniref:uracil-DNA glycosylase family protein n=1 Tax=Campylobacter fetus TaxID=196 RepID=UPI0013C11DEB|nr:uracil-DNA glycosylase [Campylobacter fetus]EJU9541001.1 uracil-DNA glycosylase [Campylobacter fetus]HDX6330546.1 uracil-DNA glycosylase [Campylobacter fetus subsp. venerealis]